MPNWIEGEFKFRGDIENVKRFAKDIFVSQDHRWPPQNDDINTATWRDETDYYGIFTLESKDKFYLKGSRRAFIDSEVIEFWTDDDYAVVVVPEFKQAWSLRPEYYQEISAKYNIDIRIYGFEMGGQFEQELEVHNGTIIKNIEREYQDYKWESVMSSLGG